MNRLMLIKKSSGKTKRLMDMCNEAVVQSKGNVLFIEKDNTLTYNVSHKVRLTAADEYAVKGFDSLYGFIAGMCAGNYDITDIFVDSTLKIGGDVSNLLDFVEKLKKLSEMANTNIVMSVSADRSEIDARIADLATEI